jgi:hypothetical protein
VQWTKPGLSHEWRYGEIVPEVKPPSGALKSLKEASNIWMATTRPDGRPHLVPVWFIWNRRRFYMCIESGSVKGRNIQTENRVALALEDGSNPVICEGEATRVPPPWPAEVIRAFKKKYDWSIDPKDQYDQLIRVKPTRWLGW